MQLADDGGVVGGDKILQHLRATGGAPAFGAEQVLVGDGQAGQRTGVTGGQAGIGSLCFGQRFCAVDSDEGVERRVQALDAVKVMRGQFDAGHLLRGQRLGQFGQGGEGGGGKTHSITFGTR